MDALDKWLMRCVEHGPGAYAMSPHGEAAGFTLERTIALLATVRERVAALGLTCRMRGPYSHSEGDGLYTLAVVVNPTGPGKTRA